MHKLTGKLVALKLIRHRSVIRLYETFESDKNIVFVIELCAGGDLLTYVRKRRKLKEEVARHVFKQIMDGLNYCHAKQILHRDIKLDNVLLNGEGEIKICDFGVSKIVKKGERMSEQCGTPAYIAPEILKGKGYDGFTVDVWSAGVVLYAILHGAVPFNAAEMNDLHKQILKGKYKLKEDISKDAQDLVTRMLELDANKRITTDQALNHAWLKATNPGTVSLFEATEKEAIRKEYAYSAKRKEDTDTATIFTEQNIDLTQSELTRNNTTKSVILAPFNSIASNESLLEKEAEDALPKRKLMKFAARVKEIDRQYEKNNNGDMDNGVFNKCAYSTQHSNAEGLKSPDQDATHSDLYRSLITGEENGKCETDVKESECEQVEAKPAWGISKSIVIGMMCGEKV